MTEQEKQRQIDALVERIDAFMKNGGGRMRVTGGEGEAQETAAPPAAEGAAEACNAPAKRAGIKPLKKRQQRERNLFMKANERQIDNLVSLLDGYVAEADTT